jgi:hypothetical protein
VPTTTFHRRWILLTLIAAAGIAVAQSGSRKPLPYVGNYVIVNGRELSARDLARIEADYRIHLNHADYWYDPMLGAWGVRGSPTLGFIAAGLKLGGPLHANASAGTTGVFVNGRQLPNADLLALQRLTGPILPDRYFITAQGLVGYEGGPAQWNLAAIAAQSGGGGGSNTWQGHMTGSSGFSDSANGAVFLPNGGIVSTGNQASGPKATAP